MELVDLSQKMEPHWAWDSFPLVSQAYDDGDEFQEFGLRWCGRGFTYSSAPGWHIAGQPSLDDLPASRFAGVATVIDLTECAASGSVNPGDLTSAIGSRDLRDLVVLYTGHSDKVPLRRREYWTETPIFAPAIAEMLAERGAKHICVDVSCDSLPARRPDKTGGIPNANEAFRARAHGSGLVVTENLLGLGGLPEEVFLFALPLRGQGLTTAPSRPVAMLEWTSDTPSVHDVSTPYQNHWRWRLEMWRTLETEPYEDRTEFLQTGHAYTHCDAPRHMERDGPTLQELPQEGLELFVGPAWIVDLSDLPLATPYTLDLIRSRVGTPPPDSRIVLRSDLTNRLGYGSTKWHTDAPNIEVPAAEWLVSQKPAAICLDFPQDYIAREMPGRHVYNHEFVTHHAVLGQGVPFIEDLKDLGEIKRRDPFLAAIPLKMTCMDGAPMRVVALEW
ncbi:MAG: cyclase family protein [Pseudomonadota bacterium]